MRWFRLDWALLLVAACARSPSPSAAPVSASALPAAVSAPSVSASNASPAPAPTAPLGPATVESIDVGGDVPASLVRGQAESRTHIVFLPGLCSNARAYLLAFPEAARAHGGVLAIDGDLPCGAADSGFRSFSWSPGVQRRRIEVALAAAGLAAPSEGITLVGYSSGASIAEQMHAKWPALFAKLVLIAPPKAPELSRLGLAKGVVTMACTHDVTDRMKRATRQLLQAKVPSIYLEMPGCTHGNVAEGERVFGEAFTWLAGLPSAPAEDSRRDGG